MFDELSRLVMPMIVLLVLLAFFIAMALFSRNYLKVAPNAVAVLSGRKGKLGDGRLVGYRMVRGGAALRIPLLENVDYLSLNVFTIPLEIKRAYTLQGVPVSVKAIANVKIRGDEASLHAAAERFLGMSRAQIQQVIFQTLEGHLRSILGTLSVEEINNDRQSFAQKPTSEAAVDLEKMGIGTAEVKRDAVVGEAEATRDAKIKSSVALQEGERAKFNADASIAEAQRDFRIGRRSIRPRSKPKRPRPPRPARLRRPGPSRPSLPKRSRSSAPALRK